MWPSDVVMSPSTPSTDRPFYPSTLLPFYPRRCTVHQSPPFHAPACCHPVPSTLYAPVSGETFRTALYGRST